MSDTTRALVLRLAGPMQSWGITSEFNRRATGDRPSKSGIVGLLAAAQGRQRGADLSDLICLGMGVRVDQPGQVLRDFHTASMPDGSPLPSATVTAKGLQKRTSPAKSTYVTTRDYLTDAVFVVAVTGEEQLVGALAEAVARPRYPLSLGRRSCPPAQPLIVPGTAGVLWEGDLETVLRAVPWQAGVAARQSARRRAAVSVSASIDDPAGDEVVSDVPVSFAHAERGFLSRQVRHLWIELPTGNETAEVGHDPFALLGW